MIGTNLYGMTGIGGPNGNGNVFSIGIDGTNFKNIVSFTGSGGAFPGLNPTGTLAAASSPIVGIGSATSGTIITGGTRSLGVTVSNSATSSTLFGTTSGIDPDTGNSSNFSTLFSLTVAGANNLNYTLGTAVQSGSASLGAVTAGTGSLTSSQSQACTFSATSTHVGVNTIALTASDSNSSNLSQTATATLTVLDHAAAAFSTGSGTLNLSFGTVQRGTHALQFQIENLPAAYRAGLDLDSISTVSNPLGIFSTDAMPYTDLSPGAESSSFDLFLNDTSQNGQFFGQFQFNLSDEKDLSGHGGQQTLVLNVTATVVPEPGTTLLLGTWAFVLCLGALQRMRLQWTGKPMRRCSVIAATCAIVMVLVGLESTEVRSQTLTTLCQFSGSNGANPGAGLTLIGDTFYGTTLNGGAFGYGTVFSLPVTGGSPTVLASFNNNNGAQPASGLTLIGNTLYGTTFNGGNLALNSGYGEGTIYSLPLTGGSINVLAAFNGSNGWSPEGDLTLIGNTLYGTTEHGGPNGYGEVFSCPVSGGSVTVLAPFNRSNGAAPWQGLTLSGSTFYGTTDSGGNLSFNGGSGFGTVFSLPVSGGTPTVLTAFNGTNGDSPGAGVTISGSTLYGVTGNGGVYNNGTIFSLPLTGGSPTVLASFSSSSGWNPESDLTLIGDRLYGMTIDGGAYGYGTIYDIPVSGGSLTVLAAFNGVDGSRPYGHLTQIGNTLYGTTEYNSGFQSGNGTVFALTLPTPEPSSLGLLGIGAAILLGIARRRSLRLRSMFSVFALVDAQEAKADFFNMPSGQASIQFVTASNPDKSVDPV
jgi:uncharacterized repeat protein (TIGR03803 family)